MRKTFLAQLSSDLNIPLLLNPGEDELNMLNSFFDSSTDDILSEISSPASLQDEKDDFNDLQNVDLMKCGPESFPNLKNDEHVDIKVEKTENLEFPKLPTSFCLEVKDEKPPPTVNTTNNLVFAQPIQLLPQKQRQITKLPSKRVPIQPKSPYTLPANKTNQVVVINGGQTIQPPANNTKVVVLENIRTVPVNNSIFSPPVLLDNKNIALGIDQIDPKALKGSKERLKIVNPLVCQEKEKDYLTSLEEKVKELSEENQRLKQVINH